MNLFTWLCNQRRWSLETFGQGPRTESVLKHIEKEIQEVREDPSSIEEWCDIVSLALNGACRAGYTPHEVCQELERKLHVNIHERKWPATVEGVPTEHIREDK